MTFCLNKHAHPEVLDENTNDIQATNREDKQVSLTNVVQITLSVNSLPNINFPYSVKRFR